ncbi:Nramp family divalent metal transporter [Fredinandcohnia humi]
MEKEVQKNVSVNVGMPSGKKSLLKNLGPAFITSALVLGPGSLTLSSKIGAIHGNQLIWMVIITVLFMMVYTEMSTRIGLATKLSFIDVVRQKWGKVTAIFVGVGAFLVTASFQAGNAVGSGLAASSVVGLSTTFWMIVMTLIAVALLFLKSFYKVLEKLMLGLVLLMLVSFGLTVILAKPSFGDIFAGLIPTVPSGSMPLIIAMSATSFSVVGAVYQSYLVQEKGWTADYAKHGVRESYLGIFILGFISVIIMIAAAAVLKPQGLQVNSAAEMGAALEPLYENWATVMFMLGLFGASFSSLVGNATIGGAMLSDGLNLGRKLETKSVRSLIMLVMVFGTTVGLIFGGSPINMIIFAQAITIIVVPFIAIAILLIANNKEIMGALKNTLWKNIVGVAGLLVLILLAINNIKNIFFS